MIDSSHLISESQSGAILKTPQASVDRFNVRKIKTFCFVPTRSCFCRWLCVFGLLTCDWTLIEASVRSDYMVFSWELILHLEVILAGEHIMGTVASHVTHRALKMMTGCDNCSLLIGWQLPSRLSGAGGEKRMEKKLKNHTAFVLQSPYIWLSWDIKDIKMAGLSPSEG